jgi:hypothetical protein
MQNFGFRVRAASSIGSCPTFRQTLQFPSPGWICIGWSMVVVFYWTQNNSELHWPLEVYTWEARRDRKTIAQRERKHNHLLILNDVKQVQAAEVSQRRTAVRVNVFTYTIHAQTDCRQSRSPLTVTFPKLSVILRPLNVQQELEKRWIWWSWLVERKSWLLPEDGNSICRNVGQLQRFDEAHTRKPRFYIVTELFLFLSDPCPPPPEWYISVCRLDQVYSAAQVK